MDAIQLREGFYWTGIMDTELRVFDIIYSLTGGGPGGLTEVINTQVFKEFGMGRYGMANALNVVIFFITVIIALIMQKIMQGKENNE